MDTKDDKHEDDEEELFDEAWDDIIGNELEASFRDPFLIENRMEVPEMYKAID